MKRILITGGAGFIGSHLCERLLHEGHDIICLDNYYTGSKQNIEHLIGHPYFELVRHDVTQPFFAEVDEIYNLACPASPIHYQHNPIKTIKTSVMGAINMLGLAKRVNAKILQASTSEVYGTALRVPIDEEHPLQAQSPYSASKISADMLGNSYHCAFGLPVTIVRPFNTFGPRQSLRAVIPTIIAQALQSRCVKLGDTRPVRDFNFVTDTAAGFLAAARHAPGRAEVYNLATGSARTIGETADLIADLVGSRIEIVHDASRDRPADSEVMRLLGNAEKARRDLGWQPAVDFRTGLQKTVEWVRENLQTYADAASFKS